MTDEEIDTSDIPPLDDAFFARAKWFLPRLYIDRLDLLQARKFASYILQKELHEKRKTQQAQADRQLVHSAFNASLIISYSRPFTSNNNRERRNKSELGERVQEVLMGTNEVDLHKRVLDLRNQAYAHSDAQVHLFEGLDYTKHLPFMKVVEILDKPETTLLAVIIKKWLCYVEGKQLNLKESLKRAKAR
jgi:hypothetical protein